MVQFTAIKMLRNGKWEDTSQHCPSGGTTVIINAMAISSFADEPLASGDPACTISMTNGDQIVVNQAIESVVEDLLDDE
tara:strand:- start:291 stop:527 length:237 start_codon:yes stop_codon:yes gene_type:complete